MHHILLHEAVSESVENNKNLILRVREGDEGAFSMLYDLYLEKIYNFCSLYLKGRKEIEECVQDVFVRLWDSRHLLDADKNIDGYIFIITRNIIFKIFDKRYNYTAIDLTAIATLSDNLNAEHILIEKEIKEAIDYIVSNLPERQQEAFNLSRYDRLSYKEIAEVMDISEKTVERHISKALSVIKKNIKNTYILLPYITLL